ncbi:MAG: KGG domain-containing protein [Gemmatimonadaceae bacterium]
MTGSGKSKRGFASMDRERQREIASKGGRAAHAKGTAHEWSSGEARLAGRKGGEVVSRNRDHMAEIGRHGGEARGRMLHARTPSDEQSVLRGDREASLPVHREGLASERPVQRRPLDFETDETLAP